MPMTVAKISRRRASWAERVAAAAGAVAAPAAATVAASSAMPARLIHLTGMFSAPQPAKKTESLLPSVSRK